MAKKRNRKHSKIDKLPLDLRDAIDMMLMGDYTYKEVADFVKENGNMSISETSVWRYANSLDATVQELRLAQANTRVIMEEIAKYPQLDTAEGILRLTSHRVLDAIRNLTEEDLKEVDPIKLINAAKGLITAASTKASADSRVKDVRDIGLDTMQDMMFASMAEEDPELYSRLRKFLDSQRGGDD